MCSQRFYLLTHSTSHGDPTPREGEPRKSTFDFYAARQLKKYNERSGYLHPFGTTAANIEAKDGGFSDGSRRGRARVPSRPSESYRSSRSSRSLGLWRLLKSSRSLRSPRSLSRPELSRSLRSSITKSLGKRDVGSKTMPVLTLSQ